VGLVHSLWTSTGQNARWTGEVEVAGGSSACGIAVVSVAGVSLWGAEKVEGQRGTRLRKR
jgi:hypothetical protein